MISEQFSAISLEDHGYQEKKTPVKTADFWNAEIYELNKYEEWAIAACYCFTPCSSYCCVQPGTLDNLACCLPVNCCNGWHKCCFKCNCCGGCERLLASVLLLPCFMFSGPLFACYHGYKICRGQEHRYYRAVDHQDFVDPNNCGTFDCNGENVCLGCEACAD